MRKLSLFLAIIMMICCVPAMATEKTAEGELLIGGDMEIAQTSFDRWGNYSSGVEKSTYVAHGGVASTKFTRAEKNSILIQRVPIRGGDVHVTMWAYTEEKDKTAGVKMSFFDENNERTQNDFYEVWPLEYKKWTELTFEAFVPENTVLFEFHLRNGEEGVIYVDDVSAIGTSTKDWIEEVRIKNESGIKVLTHSDELLAKKQAAADKATLGDSPNLIGNPGFEEGTNTPTGWTAFSRSKWGEIPQYVSDVKHSGKKAVKLSNYDQSLVQYNPWVMYEVYENTEPNDQYLVSAWVKKADANEDCGFFLKVEITGKTGDELLWLPGVTSNKVYFEDEEWHEIKFVFTVPDGANNFMVYTRLAGTGTVYYDDVQFGRVGGSAESFKLKSDRIFYYTQEPTGLAYAEIFKPQAGAYIQFEIKDGETVIASEKVDAKAIAKWNFETSVLKEKGKEYILSATYYDANGSIIDASQTKGIYRYDRSPMVNDKGQYIVDGEPQNVFLLYGGWEQFFPQYKELGVKVIRARDPGLEAYNDLDKLIKVLDKFDAYGLKMLIALYYTGLPAGHPFQIEQTKRIVTAVKDHPAVAGYMLMDEPSFASKGVASAQTYEEMLEYLVAGSKAVRDIDPFHPIFNIDTMDSTDETRNLTSQVTDIFSIDSYPLMNEHVPAKMYDDTLKTKAIIKENHPFWTLGGQWEEGIEVEEVESKGILSSMYQTFFGGAVGYGFYTSDYQFPSLYDTLIKVKKSGEIDELFDHFAQGNSKMIAEKHDKEYKWRTWIKESGEIYLAIYNSSLKNENIEVEIPLVSKNGKFKINNFYANRVTGNLEAITGTDGVLKLSLEPLQSSLYKITTTDNVDASLIDAPAFDDMNDSLWAQEAVENLYKEDIVNKKGEGIFAPSQNITRGDFAYFLIRTLGLTTTSGETQFEDVPVDSEYAQEILIGKKAGIFKGSGNNMFEPESEISRQDMMTMCARALKLVNPADLSLFTDNALIADYAKDSVAAMVKEGIVAGYPDGTISPLSNTTRAEAAVIMERILAQ